MSSVDSFYERMVSGCFPMLKTVSVIDVFGPEVNRASTQCWQGEHEPTFTLVHYEKYSEV